MKSENDYDDPDLPEPDSSLDSHSQSEEMDGSHSDQPFPTADHPLADLRDRAAWWNRIFGSSRMWIATAICAAIAITLMVMAWTTGGTTISISFQDGFGIKPGDTLRFRGIDVGEVTQVDVNSELNGVVVRVELNENAGELAREGARFWIERPQVGLARISGLDTVVGAKYIGVIPGDVTAKTQYQFQGIESPPVIRDGSNSRVTITFNDGHGIATGAVVRHLGIVIGEVTAVDIADTLDSVTTHIRLTESAAQVARAGSQFWIERPELGILEIRGLETLIRGPHIDFLPGPADGPKVATFIGLNIAPPATRADDGLEVVLACRQQRSLKPGVPVTYRGLNVGHVVSVGLASDASSVQARVYIEPDYKTLVRINSQFWTNVGLDADFSVTGIELRTDSLQSLAVGSIGFATPNNPGRRARTGDRFTCATKMENEWLQWSPQIAIGAQMLPEGMTLPSPIRATISWKRKRLGVSRQSQRQGWLLLLDDGQLTGLKQYLTPNENAIEDSVLFEMSGAEFAYDPTQLEINGGLASYNTTDQLGDAATWPRSKTRRPVDVEDCLIVADPQAATISLVASHIEETREDRWLIAPSISYNPTLDGACVISREDGALLGFLDLQHGQAEIVFIQKSEEPLP